MKDDFELCELGVSGVRKKSKIIPLRRRGRGVKKRGEKYSELCELGVSVVKPKNNLRTL